MSRLTRRQLSTHLICFFLSFSYVLPPPSRPRTWVIPAGPYAPPNYNNQPPKQRNYAELVRPGNAPAGAAAAVGTVSVPGLAAQYVPGVGIKYTAIVTDKLQGKYNAKTKKYKAYEKGYDKGKYVPWNYVRQYDNRRRYLRYW